jgi:hypothetical protein
MVGMPDFDSPPIPELEVSGDLYRLNDGRVYALIWTAGGVATYSLVEEGVEPGERATFVTTQEWETLTRQPGWSEWEQGSDIRKLLNSVKEHGRSLGPEAMADPGVIKTLLELGNEQFMVSDGQGGTVLSQLALTDALFQTEYFQQTLKQERAYNSMTEVQRDNEILNKAGTIVGLWRMYLGESLTLPGSLEELRSNPAFAGWYQQAELLAKGMISQTRLINTWIQPEALKNDQSPWSRTLEQEDRQQNQERIDVETKRGEVRDLADGYGLSLSDEELMGYGQQLVDNDLSLDELEEKIDAQSVAFYGYKPPGMRWTTYADPYRRAKMELHEVALPDHTDEGLQEALQDGISLREYKKNLRSDSVWPTTTNGRNTIMNAFSVAGRHMGFG